MKTRYIIEATADGGETWMVMNQHGFYNYTRAMRFARSVMKTGVEPRVSIEWSTEECRPATEESDNSTRPSTAIAPPTRGSSSFSKSWPTKLARRVMNLKTSVKAAIGAAVLTVAFASSAAAGWCKPHNPPPPPVIAPEASICLYGDPRALVTLDNAASTGAHTFRVIWWTGRDNTRTVLRATVRAGGVRPVRLWAHGQRPVIVRFEDGSEIRIRVTSAAAKAGRCVTSR